MTITRAALAVALAVAIFVPPLATEAQQSGNVPRIAFLSWRSDPVYEEAFRRGLRQLGYVEGQSIAIVFRSGLADQLPNLAAELVRKKVDIIVARGTPAVFAAKQATQTIPIVIVLVSDPVESGLVVSLARPGGNITGLSLVSEEVVAKQLELLKEAVPQIIRVAMLIDPTNPAQLAIKKKVEPAAKALGMRLQRIDVRSAADLDGAFAAALRQRADAFLVSPLNLASPDEQRIVEFAIKNRLPTMTFTKKWVETGGLMLFAPDFADQVRRTATYVDKILKGAKPGDLPIEQPTKFELVINAKTAKALGLTIPPSLLARANKVLE